MSSTASLPAWAQALSLTEYRPGLPHPYIGKCRQCKATVRILVTTHCQLVERQTRGRRETYLDTVCRFTSEPSTARRHAASGTWSVPCPTAGCVFPHSHGQASWITLKPISGYIAPAVKCDPRCTGATGPNCECSCGGENHGSAHAMSQLIMGNHLVALTTPHKEHAHDGR